MRQQKIVRIVAIVVVSALVISTLLAGIGSLFGS
ncbi:stressosome-associated protein Prli42 [Paenibacillus sp. HB172176]|nr:stressosome-associated protein Prli42 [Paenibacillus sp. HB172176]